MEQLSLFPTTARKVCAFTGHRDLGAEFDSEALLAAIRQLAKEGVDTFLCGMAVGFDLLAAEFVLTLTFEYPHIKLIPCLPCPNQDKYYDKEDTFRYLSVLSVCEEKICLAERYYSGCMLARDRYMVDHADILLAYCKKQTGGTAYTVKYFQKKKPDGKIIFL